MPLKKDEERDYSPSELISLCNVNQKTIYRNMERIKGHYRIGKLHRFRREIIDMCRLNGQNIFKDFA